MGVLLAIFQQVTGINTIIYYAPTLLNNAGLTTLAALLANVVNGVINVGMASVAISLLDKVGRRTLLVSGTCGMALALTVIAVTFLVGGSHLTGTAAIVTIVFLFFYTGSFAIGLGRSYRVRDHRSPPGSPGSLGDGRDRKSADLRWQRSWQDVRRFGWRTAGEEPVAGRSEQCPRAQLTTGVSGTPSGT